MKAALQSIILDHLQRLGIAAEASFAVDHPKAAEHGDFSCNVAMVLAKGLKVAPRDLAQKLVQSLQSETEYFAKVEVAGPGFINFFLKPQAYQRALAGLWKDAQALNPVDIGHGQKVLIEFVSANPTGPMHVGHGRNAVVGDSLARLLAATGFAVTREFYINDHGVQIKTLGMSGAHYHSVLMKVHGYDVALPEDMYRGAYLEELVDRMADKIAPLKENPMAIGKLLGVELLTVIKEELGRLNVVFDHYFSESSLYQNGEIDAALKLLKQKGLTYEQEGALWFKTTDFGDDKDRVLIKTDNSYTYMTPDIAYHKNKFERDFDLYLNVMGADHGGYVQRMKAAVAALGYNPDQLKFLLMQLVNLKRGNETVSMSKRTGDYVTLHEVIDEVGKDAARFFFMMRSHNAALDFDLELAKQKSSDNPVFYIQYAHARIASILRFAESEGLYSSAPSSEAETIDFSLLVQPEEIGLVKLLMEFPDVVESSCFSYEPQRITTYLHDLATAFHKFYHEHRVVTPDRSLSVARLALCSATRTVLANGCKILGISAPERM